MKKLLLLLSFLVSSCALIHAQGVTPGVLQITNSQGLGLPGVVVTVCTATAVGNPAVITCNTPVTVYQDPALTQPYTTLVTNGFGNFYFFLAPSTNVYCYTVSGAPTADSSCHPFSVAIVPDVTLLPMLEGSCTGAATGLDILCANSGIHGFEASLNGGAFTPIPLLAGDLGGTEASPQVVSAHFSGGTQNTLAKFNASGNPVNSSITDNGTTVALGEPVNAGGFNISNIGTLTAANLGGNLNAGAFNVTNFGTGSQFTGAWENLTGTQSTTFGANAVTTTETIIPASPFPISAPFSSQFDYLAVNLNGLDFKNEINLAEGRSGIDAVAGGIHVPSTQTATSGGFALQTNAVAGYVFNEGPNADPVALFGMARANYNSPGQNQSWAANLLVTDTVGMTQNGSLYGLEIDVNKLTNKTSGWAQDFNGNFNGIGGTFGGILFTGGGCASGNGACWGPGIEFGTGSTKAPDTSQNGAIVFQPVSSANSSQSQGMLFEGIDSGGVTHYGGLQLSAAGELFFNVPGTAIRWGVDADGTVEFRRMSSTLGGAPSCSATGIGTGACSITTGSTDTNGAINLAPAGAPSSSGTAVLTFNAALGANAGNCVAILSNAQNGWNSGASLIPTSNDSTASVTFSWNNNGANLGAGNNYRINYWCAGR